MPILGQPPSSILGEELNLSLHETLAQSTFNLDSPWWHKYLEFSLALVKKSNGSFPVGHGSEIGPTDLHAVFRGYTQSIMDLMTASGITKKIMRRLGEVFRDMAIEYWKHIPLFEGGYFDCQYHIWSPGSIIRLQVDATAVYSPTLYRKLVMDVGRMIAQSFDNAFIHLHSTSMFLLDDILGIEEIKGFQINYEDSRSSMEKMIPYFRKVQDQDRSLLARGTFTSGELLMLSDELSAAGLYIQLITKDLVKVEKLLPLLRETFEALIPAYFPFTVVSFQSAPLRDCINPCLYKMLRKCKVPTAVQFHHHQSGLEFCQR